MKKKKDNWCWFNCNTFNYMITRQTKHTTIWCMLYLWSHMNNIWKTYLKRQASSEGKFEGWLSSNINYVHNTSTMNCIQAHTTIELHSRSYYNRIALDHISLSHILFIVIARTCWVALIVDWMIDKIDCCRWQTWSQVALPWK
jgi:hypothetical protein